MLAISCACHACDVMLGRRVPSEEAGVATELDIDEALVVQLLLKAVEVDPGQSESCMSRRRGPLWQVARIDGKTTRPSPKSWLSSKACKCSNVSGLSDR